MLLSYVYLEAIARNATRLDYQRRVSRSALVGGKHSPVRQKSKPVLVGKSPNGFP
jgi:hypothetical protein